MYLSLRDINTYIAEIRDKINQCIFKDYYKNEVTQFCSQRKFCIEPKNSIYKQFKGNNQFYKRSCSKCAYLLLDFIISLKYKQ